MGATGHRMIAGGNKVVALAATPESLVAASNPDVVLIWVGAPHNDAGAAQNTTVARLGPAGQEIMQLMPADAGGFYIPHCDPVLLYVDVGVNGESVDYALFA